MNQLILTPENEQLRKRFEELKNNFSELFTRRDEMLRYEESKLNAIYLSLLGHLQYEEFCLQTDVAKYKLQISLMQMYINRNETIDLEYVDKQTKEAMENQRRLIEEQEEQLKKAKEYLLAPTLSVEETTEMKALYRVLVKRLHPDLNPNQTEEEKEMFLRVKAAYEVCKLDELQQIILNISMDKKVDLPEISLADEVERLEKQVVNLTEQIEKLNARFPFTFREKLADKNWVEQEQQKIKNSIEEYKTQVQKLKIYAEALRIWKPGLSN